MPIFTVTKKCEFIVLATKNSHPVHRHFTPLWPRAPKF